MNTENKTYTIEVTENEAEEIEQAASSQGVSVPDYIVYWFRTMFFGINNAVDKLAEAGHVGQAPWNGKD